MSNTPVMSIEKFTADRRKLTKGLEEAQIAFVGTVYHYAGADNYNEWVAPYDDQRPTSELNDFSTGDDRMGFFLDYYDSILALANEAAQVFDKPVLEVFGSASRVIDDYGNGMIFPDALIEEVFIKKNMQHLMANALIDAYICNTVSRTSCVYRIWARTQA